VEGETDDAQRLLVRRGERGGGVIRKNIDDDCVPEGRGPEGGRKTRLHGTKKPPAGEGRSLASLESTVLAKGKKEDRDFFFVQNEERGRQVRLFESHHLRRISPVTGGEKGNLGSGGGERGIRRREKYRILLLGLSGGGVVGWKTEENL